MAQPKAKTSIPFSPSQQALQCAAVLQCHSLSTRDPAGRNSWLSVCVCSMSRRGRWVKRALIGAPVSCYSRCTRWRCGRHCWCRIEQLPLVVVVAAKGSKPKHLKQLVAPCVVLVQLRTYNMAVSVKALCSLYRREKRRETLTAMKRNLHSWNFLFWLRILCSILSLATAVRMEESQRRNSAQMICPTPKDAANRQTVIVRLNVEWKLILGTSKCFVECLHVVNRSDWEFFRFAPVLVAFYHWINISYLIARCIERRRYCRNAKRSAQSLP